MLAIKLRRIGKKHQPSFRIIVAEKRSKISGRFVEDLGWVNRRDDKWQVNKERALYWLKVGAKPTDVVYNLFVEEGIIEGKKIPVHKKSKKEKAVNLTEEKQEKKNVEEKTEENVNENAAQVSS